MANRICAWCKTILGTIDWSECDTHGVCHKCVFTMESNELVKFSLIVRDCLPFEEVITRAGAASILRAIRHNENYISYSVGGA